MNSVIFSHYLTFFFLKKITQLFNCCHLILDFEWDETCINFTMMGS